MWGKDQPRGDLKISFSDRNPRAVAKEELFLEANVVNEFSETVSTNVGLFLGEEKLDGGTRYFGIRVTLLISFDRPLPKPLETRRYRLEITSPEGDVDANEHRPLCCGCQTTRTIFNPLSVNQPRILPPFIKRSLSKEEQFDFQALVRLGENVFHSSEKKWIPNILNKRIFG